MLRQAEKSLLSERIRQINFRISQFQDQKLDVEDFLFTHLPSDRYDEVVEFTRKVAIAETNICKPRQQKKFASLKEKQIKQTKPAVNDINISPDDIEEATSRWVINVSDCDLNEHEQSLLKKGLHFAVSPTKIPVDDIVTAVESAVRLVCLGSSEAAEIRNKTSDLVHQAKLPKSNITREEREVFRSLQRNKDIMVVPADKGRTIVVMNSTDYNNKAKLLLSDNKTYVKLKSKLVKSLQSIKQSGAIIEIQYRKLYPTSEEVPKFYGLPKIYKPNHPLRLIVACSGSITYASAKFIADIIFPLVGLTEHHIKNSKDLVTKREDFTISENEELVSYDVTALFTCTPVNETIDIIESRLKNDPTLGNRTCLSVDQIIELLRFQLTTTYFQYGGEFYNQLEGAAMGSPVSPLTANIFMEDFEIKALSSYPNPHGSGVVMLTTLWSSSRRVLLSVSLIT
ncbi:uncharacterized protein [Amphiura filiformis]|uniref:uncharacterized protein n=1 Tax=Amphiura filiformis TaxID=82378 RepID=UPI003B20E090